MGIGKITLGNFGSTIFKSKTNNQNVTETKNDSKMSNPFGVSFKGNVINADVFESTKLDTNNAITEKTANRGKLFVSALVGNINNFNDSIKSRINSVISFGRQMKDKTIQAVRKIAHPEIDLKAMGETLRNTFTNQYSVNNLSKRSVSDLEVLLKQELA